MNEKIELLAEERIEDFSNFVGKVFDEFVAKDYSLQGNATFHDFIRVEEIRKRFWNGNFYLVYEIDGQIAGAVELRDRKHICLLFVDAEHQRKGIATRLFSEVKAYITSKDPEIKAIEVNSSPYAKDIYKKLGFTEKSDLKEQNGIKYYELEYYL